MIDNRKYMYQYEIFVPELQKACDSVENKTAELLQRRPRDAPNIWVP